jgi:FkbM family methyltransferase
MISRIFRSIPPFKGKLRLAQLLLAKQINSKQDATVRGDYECVYKLPNIKENIGFEIFVNGIYEKDTIAFIVNHLKSGKIFIDIGANIGAISVPVLKQRKDIKAVCIEAAPWIFDYLQVNLAANGVTAVSVNKAISDIGKKQVEFFSPLDKFGKGSLAPVFTSSGVSVETITLDELLKPYDPVDIGLIKIDVEGFEYAVFLGGSELLKREDSPDILFEFVDWAENSAFSNGAGLAQSLLFEYGYKLYFFGSKGPAEEITHPVKNGSYLFFASKRPLISVV